MNIKYRKRFLKELVKIPQKTRIQIEEFVFNEIPQLNDISKAGNIENIKGIFFLLQDSVWFIQGGFKDNK